MTPKRATSRGASGMAMTMPSEGMADTKPMAELASPRSSSSSAVSGTRIPKVIPMAPMCRISAASASHRALAPIAAGLLRFSGMRPPCGLA